MTYIKMPNSANAIARPPEDTSLFLAGMACVAGDQVKTVADAVLEGSYSQQQAEKDGYTSLRHSEATVPEMAMFVSKSALQIAEVDGESLGLISFTSIHDHGHARLWQPSAYIQNQLSAQYALAWNLSFGCNGFALGVLQAALLLPGLSGPALIVGADRFDGTGFDRWTSDQGLAYGDAASAVVLSAESGFAEVTYLNVEYATELEALHRLDQVTYPSGNAAWNITASKRGFINQYGGKAFFDVLNAALDRLEANVISYLRETGTTLDAVVTPFVGMSVRATTYDARFHRLAAANASAFGATIGHTGTSDQLLGLAHLIDNKSVKPGGYVLMIGAGAGFSLSAMVVRLNTPATFPLLGEI